MKERTATNLLKGKKVKREGRKRLGHIIIIVTSNRVSLGSSAAAAVHVCAQTVRVPDVGSNNTHDTYDAHGTHNTHDIRSIHDTYDT
jgi:hypothetical protein